jgi:hypothetical protein
LFAAETGGKEVGRGFGDGGWDKAERLDAISVGGVPIIDLGVGIEVSLFNNVDGQRDTLNRLCPIGEFGLRMGTQDVCPIGWIGLTPLETPSLWWLMNGCHLPLLVPLFIEQVKADERSFDVTKHCQ